MIPHPPSAALPPPLPFCCTWRLPAAFAAVLFLMSLGFAALAGVTLRWSDMLGMFWWLPAMASYVWAAIKLAAFLRISPWGMRRPALRGWLVGIAAVAALYMMGLSSQLGHVVRMHEINSALSLGLEEDSIRLLDQWPGKSDRIFPESPEFQRLPASIRSLSPVYVTISRPSNGEGLPENIGICKCGFGGFAEGVRVFRNEAGAREAMTVGRSRGGAPITKRVLLWWQTT